MNETSHVSSFIIGPWTINNKKMGWWFAIQLNERMMRTEPKDTEFHRCILCLRSNHPTKQTCHCPIVGFWLQTEIFKIFYLRNVWHLHCFYMFYGMFLLMWIHTSNFGNKEFCQLFVFGLYLSRRWAPGNYIHVQCSSIWSTCHCGNEIEQWFSICNKKRHMKN